MKPAFKPLSAQVVVVTGATSGIGLATARRAASHGANLMLVARNAEALAVVADDLRRQGGRIEHAAADVADAGQVQAAAERAIADFGGFDTWVNAAGVGSYGRIEDTPVEDQRRLFDVNYWGVVHGSLAALAHLRTRPGGGAIVNVGSVLGDQAVPMIGPYCASKHAVRGFTKALRMELARSAPNVAVTLIKPGTIDTPFKEHVRNLVGGPMTVPPLVYAAPLVAEAIAHAATHRVRDLTVGGSGRAVALFGQFLPTLAEPLLAAGVPLLMQDRPGNHPGDVDSLDTAGSDGRERGRFAFVRRTSLYLRAQLAPGRSALVWAGVGGALWLAAEVASRRQSRVERRA